MSGSLTRLITRNWAIKLAALALALMLYVAVAAQQPVTQTFSLKIVVLPPPGRALLAAPPTVSVLLSGRGSEMLRLRSLRPITLRVPDTLTASVWTLSLKASDIDIPKGADVQVNEISPRDIAIRLDSVAGKDVRIVPLVRIVAESGYQLQGGLAITPSMARIVGSDRALAAIESLTTVPTEIANVTGPFTRSLPIDTAPLGVVRIAPKEVTVSGDLSVIHERSFAGIPVESGAGALTSFVVTPARVSVVVRGADAVVQRLTRDSLKVIVHLPGRIGAAGAYARLTVIAPRGITARAIPDSVALRKKTGRG